MRTTKESILMIAGFEGCPLEAYRGPDGIWTIGRGHTRNVKEGQTCTQAQADQWFMQDLAEMEQLVLACIPVQVTDNQVSACVSFAFNVGLGYPGIKDGFKVLKSGEPSTLLRLIGAREFAGAAAEFPKWDKIEGVPCPGILRRRLAEQALFLCPDTIVGGLVGEP